ncbi:histone-lysine N-methyltransferase SUV39H2-like [Lineus longissimus]|uniref:histone-lysine N-methyltransferase SUV39H2-like n=1 Tax=Lineus longissimus TaxID=88925 RepID=UPI002B4E7ABA
MVYQTLKKLGPHTAQKLIGKLVDNGDIKWDNDEDFEVETIVDHYSDEDGNKFYRIKWRGWSSSHNTWEPEDNLNCPVIVQEYNDNLKGRGIKRKLNQLEDTDTRKARLDELFQKLLRFAGDISPLMFLRVKPSEIGMQCVQKIINEGLVKSLNGKQGKRPVLKKLKRAPNYANKNTKAYKSAKSDVLKALKMWEDKINDINTDPAKISIINDVDLEGPPAHFTFISDYIEGEGITIPQDPLVGCECNDCLFDRKQCCPANMGTEFPYYRHKRVRVPPGTPIYECNKRCRCGVDCPNRVVQLGRKFKVAIFRTENRGWGVKALQKIKKGTFVMEYVGEVITSEEAEGRGHIYDAEGMTYLFDLDFNDGDNPFTVDARNYGNVSHFVNHSCEPNMAVYGVWINTLDPSLPRIALFSTRDILKGEELTFDYMMKIDAHNKSMNQSLGTLEDNGDATESEVDSKMDDTESEASFVNHKLPNFADVVMTESNLPCQHLDGGAPPKSPKKQYSPIKRCSPRKFGVELLQMPNSPSKRCSPRKTHQPMIKPHTPKSSPVEVESEISRLLREPSKMFASSTHSLASSPTKGEFTLPNPLPPSPLKSSLADDVLLPLRQTCDDSASTVSSIMSKASSDVSYGQYAPGSKAAPTKKHRLVCQCGAEKCRGFLF